MTSAPATVAQMDAAILKGVTDSGETAFPIVGADRNPRRFGVTQHDEALSVWAYIWNLTPGGRPELPYEYRIQMTSVGSPLELNPSGATVLLGDEPERGTFAGFDLRRHREFTPGSPSIQIDIRVVEEASALGLAFDRKGNDELAIGIRPDHLHLYFDNAQDLHDAGADAAVPALLTRAANAEEILEPDLEHLAPGRRRVVREVSSLSRSARFRTDVLDAYGWCCAITGTQLGVVEAAHILPVAAGPESIDVVQNGIALAPTYHRAFDRALIYLDEAREIRLNPTEATRLRDIDTAGGLGSLQGSLGKIRLPRERKLWPSLEFIKRANEYRGIQV